MNKEQAFNTMVICIIVLLFSFALFIMNRTTSKSAVKTPISPDTIRYLPIGDSYTIGEGVSEKESFPRQLVERLMASGKKIELITNPAVTGFTSADALNYELPIFEKSQPTFTTVLIGVNDQFRGLDKEQFRANFQTIIARILKVIPDKKSIIIITIPDYSITPFAKLNQNGGLSRNSIASYNQIIKDEAKKNSLKVVDIYSVSQKMGTDASYILSDGLHPSTKMYTEWVDLIYKSVIE